MMNKKYQANNIFAPEVFNDMTTLFNFYLDIIIKDDYKDELDFVAKLDLVKKVKKSESSN